VNISFSILKARFRGESGELRTLRAQLEEGLKEACLKDGENAIVVENIEDASIIDETAMLICVIKRVLDISFLYRLLLFLLNA